MPLAKSVSRAWCALSCAMAIGVAAPKDVRAAVATVTLAPGIEVRVPDGWSVAPAFYSNATEWLGLPEDELSAYRSSWESGVGDDWTPRAVLMVEQRRGIDDAEHRLAAIAGERVGDLSWTTFDGWPGMVRSADGLLNPRPRIEPARDVEATFVSLAVAIGDRVLRIEVTLPRKAVSRVAESLRFGDALRLARSGPAGFAETVLQRLRGVEHRRAKSLPRPSGNGTAMARETGSEPGVNVFVQGGAETEVVASADGTTVIVASQGSLRTSNDGGLTFPISNGMPFSNFGDPSLAVGQSGNFYLAGINNTAGCGNFGCATGIARSTDDGATFPFLANAVTCPTGGPNACFPDQEHIAADRWNAAAGNDQVYSVWRNFTSGELPTIVCSQDSGANWTAPVTVDAAGAWARVSVGSDGFVYVTYADTPDGTGDIRLHKYSSCASGLVAQPGFPVTVVSNYDGVVCPVAGLDRCNRRNTLASYTVAVDDTNPSHVYFTYAENDGSGEDVLVLDSTDGGATWPRSVVVNSAGNAQRFMPWSCAMNGVVHVGWYDRRTATVANNDLTEYYRGSASVSGPSLVAGAEVNVSGVSDPSCQSGWPCATDQTTDSESCSIQPQLAGICQDGSGVSSTGQRCDFTTGPACPGGESCSIRRGCPKYGDYTGIACGGGYVFVSWASGTPPPGVSAPAGINTFIGSERVGGAPDLSLTLTDAPDPVIALDPYAYTLVASNGSGTLAQALSLSSPLPAGVTFLSVNAPGWSCATPAVNANGNVTCTLGALAGNSSATPVVINVRAPDAITTVSMTSTLTSNVADPTPADNQRTEITTVHSPALLSATKALTSAGPYPQYAAVIYSIAVANAGPGAQFDNPGDEFTDTLPDFLGQVSASASFGSVLTSGNTVTWNGKIPAAQSVVITVNAAVAVASHQTISNQGSVHYDADGNGTNEAAANSDDPAVGGANDPTVFESAAVIEVPALGRSGLAALTGLLLAGAFWVFWRRR